MPDVRLYWLGPPAVEINRQAIHLEMRKSLALLAYLSLSPQNPTRETLAALFWPDYDQKHALSNLRRNLSSLTSSLPPDLFETDRESIGLRKDERVTVDIQEFHQALACTRQHSHPPDRACPECISPLEKAVALYRGDFFEGFTLKDCPEFDEWQFYQRENLRSEYAGALEKLADDHSSRCDWEKAVLYARLRLALDRLHEPAQRMLIKLYFLSGQRSSALRQYDECRRILENELGEPPEPETVRLYEQICSGSALELKQEPAPVPVKAAGSRQAYPLLKTKLFIPKMPRTMVLRPRLVALLDKGIQQPLTLVSASAGFGKTTLLAEWAAQTSRPIAWVGIDSGDNDPYRLVAYIINAIREVVYPVSNAGAEAIELLHTPSLSTAVILSSFINDLSQLKTPVVLVLDDYHLIEKQAAHEVVNFILEHQPDSLRLVLSTRIDPPLSLARMRANHQMYEVRTDLLRFTTEEAKIFLNQIMGLGLLDEDIAILGDRTEGWIAGFKMASIALQAHEPDSKPQYSHEFIHTFSGSHRFILDYLMEEVLNSQPALIRSFLMKTSILDRFCAGLCETVTGPLENPTLLPNHRAASSGDQIQVQSYQQIIEYLDHANLFLIPLDEERNWYRYHHLFADLLKARLNQSVNEQGLRELHIRASAWLEQNNQVIESLSHASEAQDYDRMARLVEANYIFAWEWNELDSLNHWMRQLPEEFVLKRPELCTYYAFLEMLRGKLNELDRYVESAENGLNDRPPGKEKDETLGLLNIIKAYLAGTKGHWAEAIEFAQKPLSPFPRYSPACHNMLGMAFFMEAKFEQANAAWHASINEDQFYYAGTIALATASLGRLLKLQGRLKEAGKLCRDTLQTISERGRQRFYTPALVDFGMADLLREENELDQALQHIQQGIASSQSWFPANALASGYSVLVKVLASKGEIAAALAAYHEAAQKLHNQVPFPHMRSELETARVQAWLAVGNLQLASAWLSDHRALLDIPPDEKPGSSFRSEYDRVYLLRVLLAQAQFDQAISFSNRMLEIADRGGRFGRVVEILALQAIALHGLGCHDEALQTLGKSLALAQPEGYVRIYLDEGPRMADLLQEGKLQGLWQDRSLSEYVDRLLLRL
ncbi:MAG: BTAD domain-containing putative transcriptional regulator [Omnitrophica WOR_2 bacterium]